MKKIFTLIITFLLSLTLFSGCSCAGCNPDTKITGKAVWHKGNAPYVEGFCETATYEVNFVKDYSLRTKSVVYDFTSTSSIENATITYGKGTYVVKVESISTSALPENAPDTDTTELYKISTSLSIPVTFDITGSFTYSFVNTITSEAYFESLSSAFQPLYSTKTYDTTSYNGIIVHRAYTTEVVWGNKAVVTIKDNTDEQTKYANVEGEYMLYPVTEKTFSLSYSKGCALDNEQLIFVTRAFNLTENFTDAVKVLDTAYTDSLKSIKIATVKAENVTNAWSLDINGQITEKTNTSTYAVAFTQNSSKYAGTPTICYYQITNYDGDEEGISADKTGRAYMVRMVTRIPYGLQSLGALDYTLKTLEITE